MNIDTKFVYNKSVGQMLAERSLQDSGKVQQYVDSTVIRLSDPYVPYLTGQLKVSPESVKFKRSRIAA